MHIAGWGITEVGGHILSSQLVETIVQVYDHDECADDFKTAQEDITSPTSIDYDPTYDPESIFFYL